MHIVFFNHTGTVSGAEKMLLLSLAKVPAYGYRTSLVCPNEGTLRANAEGLGTPCYEVRSIQARFTYNPVQLIRYVSSIGRTITGLRRTLLSLRPDLIQANTIRAGIAATLATMGTRIPVIWHSHDILPAHPVTRGVRWLAHSTRRNRLVACSQAAANCLRPADTRDKDRGVTVILNGIETERYRRNDETRQRMRDQLGFGPDTVVIGIVGQITKRKGQLGLIQAFAHVRNAVPGAVLVIVGEPLFNKDHDYLKLSHDEVARLGLQPSVHFLGHRSDAPNVMQALDMVVVNSEVEPFALVLVEAMAMEKAVVATASGGTTELIDPGVNGDIVPVGDIPALAKAMIWLANQPNVRAEYGERGSRYVHTALTTERYIGKWCALYNKIAAESSPGQVQGKMGAAAEGAIG
jgi:L-malate glycosyltransferase